eukprot:SAG11_NODE_25238_length_361_cov_1.454198_1_plen_25_part_10
MVAVAVNVGVLSSRKSAASIFSTNF